MIDFIKQNPYVLIVVAIFVVMMIVTIMNAKKNKGKVQAFLAEHPDAAKVMLASKMGVTQEVVQVFTVNGEAPILFTQKAKGGFYAIPGSIKVEANYTHTRPGVMYESVTKSTDVIELELEVEANKTYKLGFDRKKEEFTFDEV